MRIDQFHNFLPHMLSGQSILDSSANTLFFKLLGLENINKHHLNHFKFKQKIVCIDKVREVFRIQFDVLSKNSSSRS